MTDKAPAKTGIRDDEELFGLQMRVLDDPSLTERDKFFFCRMICRAGFRGAWRVSFPTWSAEDLASARALHDQGYLVFGCDADGWPYVGQRLG